LLDRDGVVNEPLEGFVLDYDRDFRFVPAFEESVRPFVQSAVPLFVLSNQSSVARELISCRCAEAIMHRMVEDLDRRGIPIGGYVICPHGPQSECECRKPKPGMLLECERSFGVDLGASAFVGDSQSDLIAGRSAGCLTFCVDAADERAYRAAFLEAYAAVFKPGSHDQAV